MELFGYGHILQPVLRCVQLCSTFHRIHQSGQSESRHHWINLRKKLSSLAYFLVVINSQSEKPSYLQLTTPVLACSHRDIILGMTSAFQGLLR
jgi:hypothetical protein